MKSEERDKKFLSKPSRIFTVPFLDLQACKSTNVREWVFSTKPRAGGRALLWLGDCHCWPLSQAERLGALPLLLPRPQTFPAELLL